MSMTKRGSGYPNKWLSMSFVQSLCVHNFNHVSINANVTSADMRRRSVFAAALVDYRLMPQDQDRKQALKPNIDLREPLASL